MGYRRLVADDRARDLERHLDDSGWSRSTRRSKQGRRAHTTLLRACDGSGQHQVIGGRPPFGSSTRGSCVCRPSPRAIAACSVSRSQDVAGNGEIRCTAYRLPGSGLDREENAWVRGSGRRLVELGPWQGPARREVDIFSGWRCHEGPDRRRRGWSIEPNVRCRLDGGGIVRIGEDQPPARRLDPARRRLLDRRDLGGCRRKIAGPSGRRDPLRGPSRSSALRSGSTVGGADGGWCRGSLRQYVPARPAPVRRVSVLPASQEAINESHDGLKR